MYTDTPPPPGGGAAQRPRRLVMLADNGVDGDSRVQKQARSAAEAGWDVTVLGVARGRDERRWEIGGASVRLLYVPPDLRLRPREFRVPLRTRLLAYPPGRLARFRTQQLAAMRADLAVRRLGGGVAVWPLIVRCLLASAWIGTRLRHTGLLTPTTKTGGSPAWARRAVRRRPWLRRLSWLAAPLRLWQHASASAASRRKEGRTCWDRLRLWVWTSTFPRRGWRWLHPYLWSYELVFGPVVDELAPDLVHANDFRMIGVAARAKTRARAAGRTLRVLWDAHEYLPGVKPPADRRWLPAMCAHEAEYARHADTVVTVSDELADLLQARHRLPRRPRVVLNAPDVGAHVPALTGGDIRAACGLGPEERLLVYGGAAAEQRGLRIMVQSLPALPGVHAAFVVARPDAPFVRAQVALAERLGVADRLHVLPYVPHEQVVPFLAGADAGVIPIHHWPNHEIALITKFFEYTHARLPLVVSDVRTMAATVARTGQGEVFTAEDIVDYRRAVEAVLGDPARYRAAYDGELLTDWTWARQATVLLAAYDDAVGADRAPDLGIVRQDALVAG